MGSSAGLAPAELKAALGIDLCIETDGEPEPSEAAVGAKRKEAPNDVPAAGTFKFPMAANAGNSAPEAAAKTPQMMRPPALLVDTSSIEDNESPAIPRTPANVRSLKRTPLHEVVCAGDVAGATAVLEEGHSIDMQEEHGFTPLHNAAALTNGEARVGLVNLLLRYGADLQRRDNEGYTCLHWAAACGHADVIDAMVTAP